MIKVCDAIMGTGKSSAAINFINEHPDRKFIYITPFIKEASRIRSSCTNVKIFEPQKKSDTYGSKVLHTAELVAEGKSIATTHQAFLCYPDSLLDSIREQEYTLIIDEDVNTLNEIDVSHGDVSLAVDAGYIQPNGDGSFSLTDKEYTGQYYTKLFRIMHNRCIIQADNRDSGLYYFWTLPVELISAFKDVYILTYLFESSSLYYYLNIHHLGFDYIGIDRRDGEYRFSESNFYTPAYTKSIGSKIHIVENEKLNQIGNDKYALSMNWFSKPTSDVEQLKKNLYNFFRFHSDDASPSGKMWSTYKDAKSKLQGKGYTKGYVVFNSRATNEYRNRTSLAYCTNLYLDVGVKNYYMQNGLEVNEDAYALSTMIQWIWRSAIRDGKEITLYLPSKRMRSLLKTWIIDTMNGGNHA